MFFLSKAAVGLLLFVFTLVPSMTSGHNCVWGLCQTWEYCCGHNECCNENEYNYLVLTAIILGTVTLIILLCSYLYYSTRRIYSPLLRKYLSINYVMMSKSGRDQDSVRAECVVQVDQTKANV